MIVTIKDWNEMLEEGHVKNGEIEFKGTKIVFNREMEYLCGKTIKIKEINKYDKKIKWSISNNMVKKHYITYEQALSAMEDGYTVIQSGNPTGRWTIKNGTIYVIYPNEKSEGRQYLNRGTKYWVFKKKCKKVEKKADGKVRGNGSTANYYQLPKDATELRHLIKHKKMEHGIGEAFCALYRLNDNGEKLRNLKKAKAYIDWELEKADAV